MTSPAPTYNPTTLKFPVGPSYIAADGSTGRYIAEMPWPYDHLPNEDVMKYLRTAMNDAFYKSFRMHMEIDTDKG